VLGELLRFIVSLGPYVAMAVLGLILFLRYRSAATACIVTGFSLVVLGNLSLPFIPVDATSAYDPDTHTATAVASTPFLAVLIHNGDIIGMWVAAVGLISHLTRQSKSVVI
jgi:hypothetical protein